MTHSSDIVESPGDRAGGGARAVLTAGPPGVRVWGLTGPERLARQCAAHDAPVGDWTGQAPAEGTVVLVRRDCVLADELVEALLRQSEAVLMDGENSAALAAAVPAARAGEMARYLESSRWVPDDAGTPLPAMRPPALVSAFDSEMGQRRARPVARLVDAENAGRTEWDLYTGAFKAVTDAPAKFLWPYPALYVTRAAVRLGLSPNAVSLAGLALAAAALGLFASGAFGWGLLAAWAAALMDTVDGKMARVTAHSSAFGKALDRLERLAAPLWHAAWLAGLAQTGAMTGPLAWIAALAVGGYLLCQGEQAWFRRRHGLSLHVWRAPDSWFRLVSASRDICLLLLTAGWIAGSPYGAIAAVAVWTGATLAFRSARLVMAEAARRRGPLRSWLEG